MQVTNNRIIINDEFKTHGNVEYEAGVLTTPFTAMCIYKPE
jgi:hypothetical protein